MFVDQLGGIVKVFNIILPILLWAITSLTNKILNCVAITFFNNLLIEQAIYVKRFKNGSITIEKYKKRHIKIEKIKKAIGQGKCWL